MYKSTRFMRLQFINLGLALYFKKYVAVWWKAVAECRLRKKLLELTYEINII